MSEDMQEEDEAEKLAENEDAIEFLNENSALSRGKLLELLMEKFSLSRDEAEKLIKEWEGKRKHPPPILSFKPGYGFRSKPKAWGMHRLIFKGKILDPSQRSVKPSELDPYFHPNREDEKAYERARKKLGVGADWLS